MVQRIRAAFAEWWASRAGRVALPNDMVKATREITGPTGFVNSPTWDSMAAGRKAYNRSFDPRVPPSLHISQRDGARNGAVIPISERCIEDWQSSNPS